MTSVTTSKKNTIVSTPNVKVTHVVHYVWSGHEGEDVRYDYEDSWIDGKGTMFKVTSLARVRDSYEYVIIAYPFFEPFIASNNYNLYNKASFVWRRSISATEMYTKGMTVENFIARIQDDVRYFEGAFYDAVTTEDDVPTLADQTTWGCMIEETDEPTWLL